MLLVSCGPHEYTYKNPPAKDPIVRHPSLPPSHAICDASGPRAGYWSQDCQDTHCLPKYDITLIYSINLGKIMTISALPEKEPLIFGATIDENNDQCVASGYQGPSTPNYTVWELSPNIDYTGVNLYMINPVILCRGTNCDMDQNPIDSWAQEAANWFNIYFVKKVDISEL